MKPSTLGILVGLGLAVAVSATTISAQESTKTTELPNDPMAACVDMKQGAHVTEEGHGAMREFAPTERPGRWLT